MDSLDCNCRNLKSQTAIRLFILTTTRNPACVLYQVDNAYDKVNNKKLAVKHSFVSSLEQVLNDEIVVCCFLLPF